MMPHFGFGIFLPVSPLVFLSLTIAVYVFAAASQRWLRGNPLANPVLLSILIVGALLKSTGTSYAIYFSGAQFIHFLLGPATVALAIPLVNNMEHIRRSLRGLLPGLFAGSLLSAVSGYGLVRLLGGTREVALSMMPKAATTPIAIGIAQANGGLPSLTAVLAILGGILAAIAIQPVMHLVRITDWRPYGLAAGTAGSGIGAAEVLPKHEIAGAFASVAIGLNGLATSLIVPLVVAVLRYLR